MFFSCCNVLVMLLSCSSLDLDTPFFDTIAEHDSRKKRNTDPLVLINQSIQPNSEPTRYHCMYTTQSGLCLENECSISATKNTVFSH